MPIKACIFDMDDVLCAYDVPRRIARLAALSGQSEDHVQKAIWESDYFARADRGEWSAETCLKELNARLGAQLSRADWVVARRVAMTPFTDMLDLVARLKARMPVALLTNNDRLLAETLDELFPALRPLFGPHLYVSADLGLMKPDPQIFRQIVARLGVRPRDALFIDDLRANVDGAKDAGLFAHQFTGIAAFNRALKGYELPTVTVAE